MNVNIILLTFFLCLDVDGYPYSQDYEDLYNNQSNWRVKRLSQISCHCCSHSFNSHCCLQCMNRLRIGKRSDEITSNNDKQWADFPGDINDDSNLPQENIQQNDLQDWTSETMVCSCCLRQFYSNPHSYNWPCCDKCNWQLRSNNQN